jgi:ribosomal protein L37AE/L43A
MDKKIIPTCKCGSTNVSYDRAIDMGRGGWECRSCRSLYYTGSKPPTYPIKPVKGVK